MYVYAYNSLTEVHIENCEGGWLPGVHSSVIRTLALQPVVLDLISSDCQLFAFFSFTSQHQIWSYQGVSSSSQGPWV